MYVKEQKTIAIAPLGDWKREIPPPSLTDNKPITSAFYALLTNKNIKNMQSFSRMYDESTMVHVMNGKVLDHDTFHFDVYVSNIMYPGVLPTCIGFTRMNIQDMSGYGNTLKDALLNIADSICGALVSEITEERGNVAADTLYKYIADLPF